VQTVVVKQCRQADSKGINGNINMNVEITNNQQTAFHSVTVFKQIRELLKKECIGKFIFPVRGQTIESDKLQC